MTQLLRLKTIDDDESYQQNPAKGRIREESRIAQRPNQFFRVSERVVGYPRSKPLQETQGCATFEQAFARTDRSRWNRAYFFNKIYIYILYPMKFKDTPAVGGQRALGDSARMKSKDNGGDTAVERRLDGAKGDAFSIGGELTLGTRRQSKLFLFLLYTMQPLLRLLRFPTQSHQHSRKSPRFHPIPYKSHQQLQIVNLINLKENANKSSNR